MPEVVRYSLATRATATGWLKGYRYKTVVGAQQAPPIAGMSAGSNLRTFADLVEVAAIARARTSRISLQRLRTAIDAARQIYGWERPLLQEQFKTDGQSVFIEDLEAGPVNLSARGQIAWVHIRDVLESLDYESDIAARWWPLGRDASISVDPSVSFGRPTLSPSGVSTVAIWERFAAGETINELAADYGVPPDLIERAIRYEQPTPVA